MALDIQFGDLLVVGAKEYPIKGVAFWQAMPGAGFLAMASVTASTKRAPAIANGKRGAAVTNLTNLVCTPLLPVGEEMEARLLPHGAQTFECFVADTADDAVLRLIVDDVRVNE